jgi:CcmD family protein
MNKLIAIILCFILSALHSPLTAAVETDLIRGNAKFNVVIIVLTIIFSGIVFFLFRMDRRLSQLEKNQKNPS